MTPFSPGIARANNRALVIQRVRLFCLASKETIRHPWHDTAHSLSRGCLRRITPWIYDIDQPWVGGILKLFRRLAADVKC
jgi:hypothetical protein